MDESAYTLRIHLLVTNVDGGTVEVDMLRNEDWLAEARVAAQFRGLVSAIKQAFHGDPDTATATLEATEQVVYLSMPEMGVEGEARVLSVQPITVTPGVGSLVTAVFRHSRGELIDLKLTDEAPIGVTPGHSIWSLDRDSLG